MTIKEEVIELQTPAGPMRTYVLRPTAEGKYPGLLLFSEIFQVTGPIRRTAALLAGHGFVVAAAEIFHELEPMGTVIPYDQAGADKGNADKIAKELSSYDADARAVLAHLQSRADCTGKLGAIGICIGGHLAFRAAMLPDVKVTTCFYGTGIHNGRLGRDADAGSLHRSNEIRGALLMVFGTNDPHIPAEGRATIESVLRVARVNHRIRLLPAEHAFMRDEGPRYDPEATDLAFVEMIRAFREEWPLRKH